MKKLYIIVLKIFLLTFYLNIEYFQKKRLVGLIVPLTGEYSYIGKSILKSTRMALNKIDDNRIVVIPKD